ncbi:hypothetical protein [uncultured Slackia sp.]|uniref:hypothetical protein n=1 Tax=uncultured Slackia sp. TaxID=665903 RepID=UPI0026DFCE85|nr:hypothetical protein [uncultured Slackia sp.]
MSQRNPMNERYQSEQPKGQTKKSASAAKPKAKAAASVYVRPAGHTPQEKKAIKKAERAKRAELDRMFYNPPTDEYKKLRRIWWVLLISAIVLTVLGMIMPNFMPDNVWATWMCIIPAYGCIIGALWLDFSKIRKVRRAYQMEMMKKHPKEVKQHMATNAANQVAQEKEDARKAKKEAKQVKRFGHAFGKKKEDAAPAPSEAELKAQAEKEAAEAKAKEEASKPIAQLKAEREAAKKAAKAEEAKEAEKSAE